MLAMHGHGYQVCIVDKVEPNQSTVSYAESEAKGLPVIYVKADLLAEPDTLPGLVRRPESGIILAAHKDVNEAERLRDMYIRDNVAIVVNSMKWLSILGCKRIILASTCAVYHTDMTETGYYDCTDHGYKSPESFIERLVIGEYGEPLGVYGYSKWLSESVARRMLSPDQDLLILRYTNPVGSHNAVYAFSEQGICSILARGPTSFTNRGECTRDYFHISDLAQLHLLIANKWQERLFSPDHGAGRIMVMNVGSGSGSSVSEVVTTFLRTVTDHVDGARGIEVLTTSSRQPHEAAHVVVNTGVLDCLLPEWRYGIPQFRKSLSGMIIDYVRMMQVKLGNIE